MRSWTKEEALFLQKKYLNMHIDDIARDIGRSRHSIQHKAQRLGLKKDGIKVGKCRARMKKELLEEMYLHQNLSTSQIAKRLEVGKTTIERYMSEFNISTRGTGEARHIRCKKNFKVTHEVKSHIDGLVLGDGHVHGGTWSGRYSQRFAKWCFPWAEKIQHDFYNFGISSYITPVKTSPQHTQGFIDLHTKSYVEFLYFRHRWYPEGGKKRVPRDLAITSSLVANWYMGDGTLYTSKRGQECLFLCTLAFPRGDVIYLADLLADRLGIDPTVGASGMIYIKLKDRFAFLDFIKDHKVPCFEYKWNSKRFTGGK